MHTAVLFFALAHCNAFPSTPQHKIHGVHLRLSILALIGFWRCAGYLVGE